jgi:UDP-4-amino-4,6-dideoxy-N-acetyl-beta-L-altrosamine transaminase
MKNYAIPYGKQFVDEKDVQAVVEVLRSDYLTQGPCIAAFEEKFADYVGASYAVAVSNGTAALHLSNIALDLKPGQKVLSTPLTFAATINSVQYCGADVDFVDIDLNTYLLDIHQVKKKLETSDPGSYAGIIVIDFAGYPSDTEKLRKIADDYNLWIIEDACHAPGGFFINSKGEKISCGSSVYSDLSTFSFHPVKHIAAGEGGMITTHSKSMYDRLLKLRTHGISKLDMEENHGGWYYEMHELGYNYRIPDINAALGISQLDKANEGLKKREHIAKKYDTAFSNHPAIKVQKREKGYSHAYHLYVMEVEDRKGLYDYLHASGVYAQIHYIPVHLLPYYRKKGWKKGDFPKVERYYEHCISLPMYPTLKPEEQEFVIQQVLKYYT